VSTGAATVQQAILDHLAGPLGTWEPVGPPGAGGWQAGTVRGGRSDVVDLHSVRVVKQRRLPGRCVVYATYAVVRSLHPLGPHDARAVLEAWPGADGGGWIARDVSSGGGDEPHRTRPWVNLGAGGWPDRFSAGGTVHGAGHAIARVRLHFANGIVLDDDVQDGVVLFATDSPVQTPATAVLIDSAGAEVRAHEAIPGV
jgi:hypothetical protein